MFLISLAEKISMVLFFFPGSKTIYPGVYYISKCNPNPLYDPIKETANLTTLDSVLYLCSYIEPHTILNIKNINSENKKEHLFDLHKSSTRGLITNNLTVERNMTGANAQLYKG